MKKILFVLLLLCTACFVQGQTTNITGVIQDPNGQVFANGTCTLQFNPTPGTPGPFNLNGNPNFSKQAACALDSSGNISGTVPDSKQINPAGSSWIVTVCPDASTQCTIVKLPLTGASQDISAFVNSNVAPITTAPSNTNRAYQAGQVNPLLEGSSYWDTSLRAIRYWDGGQWQTVPFTSGVYPVINISDCLTSSGPGYCNGAVIASLTPGTGYSGNWTCSISGGTPNTSSSGAKCIAKVNAGGLYVLISDPGKYSSPPTTISVTGGVSGSGFAVSLDSSTPRTLSQWTNAAVAYIYSKNTTGIGVITLDPTATATYTMNTTAILPKGVMYNCNNANIDWRGSFGSAANNLVSPAVIFAMATSPILPTQQTAGTPNGGFSSADGCNFTNHGNVSYVDFAYDKNNNISGTGPNYTLEFLIGGDPNGVATPSTYIGTRVTLSHMTGAGMNTSFATGNNAFVDTLWEDYPQTNLTQIGLGTILPCGAGTLGTGENLRVFGGSVANAIHASLINNCGDEVNLIDTSLDYSNHWGWKQAYSTVVQGVPKPYTDEIFQAEMIGAGSKITSVGGHIEHSTGGFWRGKSGAQFSMTGGVVTSNANAPQMGVLACDIIDASNIRVVLAANSFGAYPTNGDNFQITGSTVCPSLNTLAGTSVVQFANAVVTKVVANNIITGTTTSTLTPSTVHFATITACSSSANVATITAANTFTIGQTIQLAGIKPTSGYCADYNGTSQVLTAASGSQFTFTATHADFTSEIETAGFAGLLDTGGTFIDEATKPTSCSVAAVVNLTPEATASTFSIASQIITINATNTFASGQLVQLKNFGATYLNGAELLLSSATSSQIIAILPFTHADVGTTSDAGNIDGITLLATIPVTNDYVFAERVQPSGMTSCAALNSQPLTLGKDLLMNGTNSTNASGSFGGGTGSANTLVSDVTPFLTPVVVTAVRLTGNVIVVITSNNYAAGVSGTLSGITGSGSDLNGVTLTVLPTGLNTTQFTATITHADFASSVQNAIFTPTLPSGAETVGTLQVETESGFFRTTDGTKSVVTVVGTLFNTKHPATQYCDSNNNANTLCSVFGQQDKLFNIPLNTSALSVDGPITVTMGATTISSPYQGLCPNLNTAATCDFLLGTTLTSNVKLRYHPAVAHFAGLEVDGDEKIRVDANALTDLLALKSTGARLVNLTTLKPLCTDNNNNIVSCTLGGGITITGTTAPTISGSAGLAPSWLLYLGDGSDGQNINASGNLIGEKYYTNFTVPFGNTLTVNSVNGLVIHATGTCTIAGAINARGVDVGATGNNYGGGSGGGGGGGTAAGTAGQQTKYVQGGSSQQAAAAGTLGTAGGGAGGAGNTPSTTFQRAVANSGLADGIGLSGASGGAGGSTGPAGGFGGAGVVFICATLTGTDGTHTGTIDVSGQGGANSTGNNVGSSGGGGGGVVILSSGATVATWPTVTTTGTAGGTCGAFTGCGAGGTGGNGWFVELSGH